MAMLVYTLYGEQLIEMFGYEQYPIGFYPLASNATDSSTVFFYSPYNALQSFLCL